MIMAVNVCLILFFNNLKYGCNKICEEAQKKPSCENCGCNFLITAKWQSNSEPLPFWCIVTVPPSLILVFATVYHALSVQPQPQLSRTFLLSRFVLFSPFLGSKQKQTKSSLFSTFHNSPLSNQTFPKPSRCHTLPQAKWLLFHPVCLQLAQASTIKRYN